MIWDQKCLFCHNKEHNYKDCRKRQSKQPMVIPAQALSIRRESRPKGFNKYQIKERPQFKATKPEPTNFSKVPGKADGHSTLALVDLLTQVGHLIYSQFDHLYRIRIRLSEKKTLNTAIQRSQGMIYKECTIQLD